MDPPIKSEDDRCGVLSVDLRIKSEDDKGVVFSPPIENAKVFSCSMSEDDC